MFSSAALAQTPPVWWKQSIWQKTERGSMWYPPAQSPQTEEIEPEPQPQKEIQPTTPVQKARPTEVVEMEAIKARLEELRTIAIVNPTPENMRSYIAFQEEQAEKHHCLLMYGAEPCGITLSWTTASVVAAPPARLL
ncbi:MAG: conjugal transfer protein TraF [Brachymonas sp.]|nr:conjugal transfer protein TraF [Brachymonas sp.]